MIPQVMALLELQTLVVVAVLDQNPQAVAQQVETADLALSLFATQTHTRLQPQLQAHPHTPCREATASTSGPAPVPLRFKEITHGTFC